VFKAHRLVYHSTLGWRVIKKKEDGDLLCSTSRNASIQPCISLLAQSRRHDDTAGSTPHGRSSPCSEIRVQGSGLRVQGSGLRVQGFAFGVEG